MDNKTLYKKLLKTNGRLTFTHKQLSDRLKIQDNCCEICNIKFNPFNGYPIILGNSADSAICEACFEGVNALGFNTKYLSKAILMLKKLG